MKEWLKRLLKTTRLYHPLRNILIRRQDVRKHRDWIEGGRRGSPTNIHKQEVIKSYARKYGLKKLVETGTYQGEMIQTMKGSFDEIYSIELSETLHQRAKERFKHNRNVELIQGDSGAKLKEVVAELDGPALFWLDAHYSAGETARGETDTPIYAELGHIFAAGEAGHVIIIDDARAFGNDPAYPDLDGVESFVRKRYKDANFEVKDDSIRIVLRGE